MWYDDAIIVYIEPGVLKSNAWEFVADRKNLGMYFSNA